MSVQKSFRLSDFTNALLEEIAERRGKKQTEIIEELIQGYVVWDLEPQESSDLIKSAEIRMDTLKAKRDE